tara:strand:- start:2775 stop:2972 length:198 start_codon:yes stop_codon:yes gene_type:complete
METLKLKNVKEGEYFKKKQNSNKTYIKGAYIRDGGLNKYSIIDFEDVNREIYLKGDSTVYIGFTF